MKDGNAGPLMLNAFDLIVLSEGLNLSAIFNRAQVIRDIKITPSQYYYQLLMVVVGGSPGATGRSEGSSHEIRVAAAGELCHVDHGGGGTVDGLQDPHPQLQGDRSVKGQDTTFISSSSFSMTDLIHFSVANLMGR